jgi:DNA-binding PadR family transcriptional regulator
MSEDNARDEIDIFDETLQDILDELVRDGMLELMHDDPDPDKRSYHLTQKGIDYVERRMTEWQKTSKQS